MSKNNNSTSVYGTSNGHVGAKVRGEMPRSSNTPSPPPPSQATEKSK